MHTLMKRMGALKLPFKKKLKLKPKTMRDYLVDAVRSLRLHLDDALGHNMRNKEMKERYENRWQTLDAILEDFCLRPTNFDSRTSPGLAEKIFKVEPAVRMYVKGKVFKLAPAWLEEPRQYSPRELARDLSVAYKKQVFGGEEPVGYDIWGANHEGEPDIISTDLYFFFSSVESILRGHEKDIALSVNRKTTDSGHDSTGAPNAQRDYDASLQPLYKEKALERTKKQDPDITKVIAWRCCTYCFRMVSAGKGKTKSTVGKTCSLHDPRKNPSTYNSALARQKKIEAGKNIKKENHDIVDVSANAKDPELVPARLAALMQIALVRHEWDIDDPIFSLTLKIFSSDPEDLVDVYDLKMLQNMVLTRFPKISEPVEFVKSIQQLIDESKNTVKRLHKEFARFLQEESLPFYPRIIALHIAFFGDESWFVQESGCDYYGDALMGVGRQRKSDHALLIETARSLREEGAYNKAQAIKLLAGQYSYTATRVRQILKEYEIMW